MNQERGTQDYTNLGSNEIQLDSLLDGNQDQMQYPNDSMPETACTTYPLQHYPETSTNQQNVVILETSDGSEMIGEAFKTKPRRESQPCPRIEVHSETPAQCETPLQHCNPPPLRMVSEN